MGSSQYLNYYNIINYCAKGKHKFAYNPGENRVECLDCHIYLTSLMVEDRRTAVARQRLIREEERDFFIRELES